MNYEKISEQLYKLACIAALPDSQKQKIWDESVKADPQYPTTVYFNRIMDQKGGDYHDYPQGWLGKAVYDK
ncbi:MAG: hypothetical protein LBI67_05515 [Treponema sp.]|jgi:hypothetical protein|nr:hypothetical protein [Treponema sp.]